MKWTKSTSSRRTNIEAFRMVEYFCENPAVTIVRDPSFVETTYVVYVNRRNFGEFHYLKDAKAEAEKYC